MNQTAGQQDQEMHESGQSDVPLVHDEDRRRQLLQRLRQEKDALKHLPSNSAYVSHRLKVIRRAEELLTPKQGSRVPTSDEVSELDRLLASLSL